MLDAEPISRAAIATLAIAAPAVYAAAAATAFGGIDGLWMRARVAAAVALLAAGGLALALAAGGERVVPIATLLPLGRLGALSLSVRLDVLTTVMLSLVAFIGWMILGYSRSYLAGDPGQARFARWFLATLAAVSLLVVSNNLLLISLGWIATSLSLHQLLTFYPERRPAIVAAHKKFIASRVADLCLLTAAAWIGLRVGSLELDAIGAHVASLATLPASLGAAAFLLALGAILKCAQLPFHGWLIQVMEAPTPVSALLHAGVVNLGGFLMIRFAPLMTHVEAAQVLLVGVGTATAVLAALVTATRVSIKVMLAWSTCAQMGFMLLECGLGAYSLALLHLVAHSLYKAHAFLSAGSVVEQWRASALLPTARPASLAAWLAAPVLGIACVSAVAAVFGASPQAEPALWAIGVIVAFALAPLSLHGLAGGARGLAWFSLASIAVTALYFAAHAGFARLLPAAPGPGPSSARLAIALAGFGALYGVHAVLRARPDGALAAWIFPRLFAGFHLDELFTRFTFRIWPALAATPEHAGGPSSPLSQEARP